LADYYSILGLDPGASTESIKVAYRRLARLHHPDVHASRTTDAERSVAEAHMAQLNEAYAVLSHGKSRREYDERLQLEATLAAKTTATSVAEPQAAVAQTKSTGSAFSRPRVRPQGELDATVVNQFSTHFLETFLTKAAGFSWKKIQLDGFHWGLEAVTWSTHYCVILRGIPAVDSAAAKKFINYCSSAVGRQRRSIRKSYFLFLLPFRQINEWESVSNQFQRFVADKRSAGILLLDIHHGRALRFGSPFPDKDFEKLIESIKTSQ
jgi:DnaJ domain